MYTYGHRMRQLVVTILLICFLQQSHAQLAIKNGVSLPTRDTLYALIVFAEVDFESGGCPNNLKENFKGIWPKDKNGKTLTPKFADEFFDLDLNEGQKPTGFITTVYHEASFGQYVLLGDYMPNVVTVPCNELRPGNNGVNQILKQLDSWPSKNGTLYSKHGFPLSHFDNWTGVKQGIEKLKEKDGRVDLLYIVWRNNRMLTSSNTRDGSGYGVAKNRGKPFKNMDGINNMASFNVSSDAHTAKFITVAEHLHGIFGGNQWHSGGGRGMHTFLNPPGSYGLTGQMSTTMQAACGWDRWMMEWKRNDKRFITSANNEVGIEMNTEDISIETFPNGGTFILRDFMEYGDALRIKLPHIDWKEKGDVKNQYLWIENRQMKYQVDELYGNDCSDSRNGEFPRGTPGIYCYLQVGKDQKEGGTEIYTGSAVYRNGLASPFFPLTGEGNYDFRWRYDMVQEGNYKIDCNWDNSNLPKDVKRSKPNPFTGNSDLFCSEDYNKDGKMGSGDTVYLGLSELIGDSVVHNYHMSGDWEDAFSSASGKMELSLSTNPAPVPVYTYGSNWEYHRYTIKDGVLPSFENRKIWLNGLKITFEELGDEKIKVAFVWDDYRITKDVRWCGDINLSPNDFDAAMPSLLIEGKRTVHIDRGESATYHEAVGKDKKGNWIFADTTKFTATDGAIIRLEPKSKMIVDADSKFVLKKGAKLEMQKGSCILVKANAELVIEDGAEVDIAKGARIIRKK